MADDQRGVRPPGLGGVELLQPRLGLPTRSHFTKLKHVLQTVGYQDTAIADELAAGFPLFGWLPESMELPRHPQPPAVDIASFERMAPALQARALARCQPTDDRAADQTLFDTTLTELQQGWLDGGPGRAKHFRHQPAFLCFAV